MTSVVDECRRGHEKDRGGRLNYVEITCPIVKKETDKWPLTHHINITTCFNLAM